ncbi:MAG: hypothetical protein ACPGFA_01250 [Pikeienuella sp.]
MQLYANPNRQDQITNVAAFETFMRRFEWAKFTQPNPHKAPWHVQCNIKTDTGHILTINFWPHLLKASYDGHNGGKAVVGLEELRRVMALAIEDSRDDLELIED